MATERAFMDEDFEGEPEEIENSPLERILQDPDKSEDERLSACLQMLEDENTADEEYEYAFTVSLEILNSLGRHQEVIDIYNKFSAVVSSESRDLDIAQEMFARSLLALSYFSEAAAILETLIQNDGLGEHFELLAKAYDGQKKPEEAVRARHHGILHELTTAPSIIRILKQLALHRPENGFHAMAAECSADIGNYAEAVRLIKEAILNEPEKPELVTRLVEYERKLQSGN